MVGPLWYHRKISQVDTKLAGKQKTICSNWWIYLWCSQCGLIIFFLLVTLSLWVLCIYQGGISCTIHFPNVPAYLDLFVGFQHLKIPSIRIKEQAYFTLARPLVEYASTVWDLYTQADIKKVEAVQRRAARYVANNHRNRSSVSNIIQRLKWRPLADRKAKSFICFTGNTIYVLVPL
jgi:hypothetical protein